MRRKLHGARCKVRPAPCKKPGQKLRNDMTGAGGGHECRLTPVQNVPKA
jgi:hypothetical protein